MKTKLSILQKTKGTQKQSVLSTNSSATGNTPKVSPVVNALMRLTGETGVSV
ncbi:MAG: hypothetical protein KGV56_05675 [Gammaproteobacteria bacterium]|nr:hypothetical protein [Gammaproteobacteria bacterium]